MADRSGLPTFLVIGAMRAGTTSLWEYLRGHPQVHMAPKKEPSFFTAAGTWDRGVGWYASLFRDAGDAKAVGEASTSYTKHPNHAGVPERIAGLIPDVKLVYVIRDPIERIRSQYEWTVHRGDERRPLAQAVLENPEYVDYSRYAAQIDRYLEWFPRDQLLVVTSEHLRDARRETVRTIFEFLGVDPSWVPPGLKAEQHVSDRQVARPFARRLRAMAGYRRVAGLAPAGLKSAYWRVARRKRGAGTASIIPDPVRRELELRLAGDVIRLREVLGDRFDGWGIA
jgi:Sulfotransferase family